MIYYEWFLIKFLCFAGANFVFGEGANLSSLMRTRSRYLRTEDKFFNETSPSKSSTTPWIKTALDDGDSEVKIVIVSVVSTLELPRVTSYMDDDVIRMFEGTCLIFLKNGEEDSNLNEKIKTVKIMSQSGANMLDGVLIKSEMDSPDLKFDSLIVDLLITSEVPLGESDSVHKIVHSTFTNNFNNLLQQLEDISFFRGISNEQFFQSTSTEKRTTLYTSIDILSFLAGIGVVIIVVVLYVSNMRAYKKSTLVLEDDEREKFERKRKNQTYIYSKQTKYGLTKKKISVSEDESSQRFKSLALDQKKIRKFQLSSLDKIDSSLKEPTFINVGKNIYYIRPSTKKTITHPQNVKSPFKCSASSQGSRSVNSFRSNPFLGPLHPGSAFSSVSKSKNSFGKKLFFEVSKLNEYKEVLPEHSMGQDGTMQEVQCPNGTDKMLNVFSFVNKCSAQNIYQDNKEYTEVPVQGMEQQYMNPFITVPQNENQMQTSEEYTVGSFDFRPNQMQKSEDYIVGSFDSRPTHQSKGNTEDINSSSNNVPDLIQPESVLVQSQVNREMIERENIILKEDKHIIQQKTVDEYTDCPSIHPKDNNSLSYIDSIDFKTDMNGFIF
mmetsp:Transcript_18589/g.42498  ORF Transcript_18589/g.42498 Transcript_18589/m.42498 type:complete len:607 (-) Transcript_18589:42-1862(-)